MSNMKIFANGRARELPSGTTLESFIQSLALPSPRVAVEHNGSIVPRDRHSTVVLAEGDRLEVVTLVGGG